MYSGIKEGASIKAKDTQMNRSCGIDYYNARGFVCKADAAGVSIYMDKGLGKGWIEARMSSEHFALNFDIDGLMLVPATAYIRNTHYSKRLPEDYV